MSSTAHPDSSIDLADLTLDEFIDVLADEIGLVHEDELVAALTGETSVEELTASDPLEAYGTGTQKGTEPEYPFAAHDVDETVYELVARTHGREPSDVDPEAYGTGVEGDTSRQEYERREERTELMADALERAQKRREERSDGA